MINNIVHDTLQSNNEQLPLVSVIVPFNDGAIYLEDCIRSIREQTYPAWELLCVFFGAKENAPEEAEVFGTESDGCRMITASGKRDEAIDEALHQAKGKYISIVNQNDYIEPVTLDLAVTRAEHDSADVVVYDWSRYNPKNKSSKYNNGDLLFSYDVLEGEECSLILEAEQYFTCNKLYRKEILDKCFGLGQIYADDTLLENIAAHSQKVSCIASPLYRMTELSQKNEGKAKSSKKQEKKSVYSRAKRKLSRIIRKLLKPEKNSKEKKEETLPIREDLILFMGFDYRYTGNSRFLFEEILRQNNGERAILFASEDERIPENNRVRPDSDEFNTAFNQARIIIFESWIPGKFKKRKGTVWIQLWHGTPLKKVCFDSNEKPINLKRPHHKNRLFANVQKWDILLADCPGAATYFRTCFLIPEEKVKPSGYPRVKYLLDNLNNEDKRSSIKETLNIPEGKKIVLYLPTWRDYNFKVEDNEFDLDYLIDLQKLQTLLQEDYCVVYKDHPYLSKPENVSFRNFSDIETQDLLLVADYLITDYSSAMFDAFAAGIPVLLYCNDYDRNEEARGVYPSIWNRLQSFCCSDEEEIAARIRNYSIDEQYMFIKDNFAYKPTGEELIELIYQL